jgi:hypothetical protein
MSIKCDICKNNLTHNELWFRKNLRIEMGLWVCNKCYSNRKY